MFRKCFRLFIHLNFTPLVIFIGEIRSSTILSYNSSSSNEDERYLIHRCSFLVRIHPLKLLDSVVAIIYLLFFLYDSGFITLFC